ncbi:MAG TPA: GAF domain-containing protein [Anaerolineae bacterium]|nr:GAF domain-containing protein [Anaerolineae bacterium]
MLTILHVSHDDESQRFIQEVLGQHYNFISVTDTPSAVHYCAMIQPDLILVDLDLPDDDGRELTLRLKMFMPQTPILNIATDQSDQSQVQTLVADSDDILLRPVTTGQLVEKIRRLLPEPSGVTAIDPNRFEDQIAALNQATKRLATLNAVSALIGTSLDLDHLTDQILGQIQKTVDFDSATLFLLQGNYLVAAASRGLSEYQRGMNVYRKSDSNSAWRVVNNKLPLIINDVLASDFWEARPELDKVRAWLGVPLIYKNRVVGVLTLDKNEINGFNEADARYVFTLAFQIAITVENAQLFEERESQAMRLKLINEVAQEITTILDVDNLFDALALALHERMNYERVAILDIDSTRSRLDLKAYYGDLLPDLNNQRQNLDHGFVSQVIKSGMPMVFNDILHDKDALFTASDVNSKVIVPIFVHSRVEAVIDISSTEIDKFSDQDLWTLSSLASQAATVIENARLYHHVDAYSTKLERIVEARTQRLQAIKKISQIVSQGLDVDEVQAVVGERISQIFSPKGTKNKVWVTIGLLNGSKLSIKSIYDPTQTNGSFQSSSGIPSDFVFKLDYKTYAGEVIRLSKPIIVNNIASQNIYTNSFSDTIGVTNSMMIAPLVTAGKTIGIIVVEQPKAHAFDESDLETLETLAFLVASAIEHARLLGKTRELAIVDERTRLARDMHDGVAQNLAYLLIQVDRCLNMVDEESKLGQQLDQVSVLLTENIEEIRRNIFDLRPVELEGKSLFEVFEKFVAEFGRRWNLKTECSITGEIKEVPAEVESSLYRILQETLANTRQHAQCSRVSVKLVMDNAQGVALEIIDDGQGFDLFQAYKTRQKGNGSRGLGLTSMRERAEGVGGRLTVETSKGQGTRVYAWLPLSL